MVTVGEPVPFIALLPNEVTLAPPLLTMLAALPSMVEPFNNKMLGAVTLTAKAELLSNVVRIAIPVWPRRPNPSRSPSG